MISLQGGGSSFRSHHEAGFSVSYRTEPQAQHEWCRAIAGWRYRQVPCLAAAPRHVAPMDSRYSAVLQRPRRGRSEGDPIASPCPIRRSCAAAPAGPAPGHAGGAGPAAHAGRRAACKRRRSGAASARAGLVCRPRRECPACRHAPGHRRGGRAIAGQPAAGRPGHRRHAGQPVGRAQRRGGAVGGQRDRPRRAAAGRACQPGRTPPRRCRPPPPPAARR